MNSNKFTIIPHNNLKIKLEFLFFLIFIICLFICCLGYIFDIENEFVQYEEGMKESRKKIFYFVLLTSLDIIKGLNTAVYIKGILIEDRR